MIAGIQTGCIIPVHKIAREHIGRVCDQADLFFLMLRQIDDGPFKLKRLIGNDHYFDAAAG